MAMVCYTHPQGVQTKINGRIIKSEKDGGSIFPAPVAELERYVGLGRLRRKELSAEEEKRVRNAAATGNESTPPPPVAVPLKAEAPAPVEPPAPAASEPESPVAEEAKPDAAPPVDEAPAEEAPAPTSKKKRR